MLCNSNWIQSNSEKTWSKQFQAILFFTAFKAIRKIHDPSNSKQFNFLPHSKQFGKAMIQAIRSKFPNLSNSIRLKIRLIRSRIAYSWLMPRTSFSLNCRGGEEQLFFCNYPRSWSGGIRHEHNLLCISCVLKTHVPVCISRERGWWSIQPLLPLVIIITTNYSAIRCN